MSTGGFTFSIFGYVVSGDFVKGKLTKGSLLQNGITYAGTFNEVGELHGNNCSMVSQYCTHTGNFFNGIMKHGKKTVGNEIIEQGLYANVNNCPLLIKGKKQTEGVIYEGAFDLTGSLTKGTIITNDGIWVGIFIIDIHKSYIMTSGKHTQKTNGVNTFITNYYKTDSDIIYCDTQYNGKLADLNSQQIYQMCVYGFKQQEKKLVFDYVSKYLNNTNIMNFDPRRIQHDTEAEKTVGDTIAQLLSVCSDYNLYTVA